MNSVFGIFRISCLVIMLVTGMNASSQNEGFHKIGEAGNFSFRNIYHGSIAFAAGEKMIYLDPWGDAALYKGMKKADFILITHHHQDHFSPHNIEALLAEGTVLIVPSDVYDKMEEGLKKRSRIMKNGEELTLAGEITIKAIAMYNVPESDKAYHTRGSGHRYEVSHNGFRIYVSGDSGDTKEMRSLEDIDLAFVCMNQPYTMTVEKAAEAVVEFQPEAVIPYHYRNQDQSLSDISRFCSLVSQKGIACRILNWYPQ